MQHASSRYLVSSENITIPSKLRVYLSLLANVVEEVVEC
jgi:hypothetical protein